MEGKRYYVYILTNGVHGALYTGVTKNLLQRIYEHKAGTHDGFTKKYGITKLVYFEVIDGIDVAIKREKQIKAWRRQWKINLINQHNPEWKDLYEDIIRAYS